MKFLLSLQSSLNTVLLGYNAFGSFVGWGLGPVKNIAAAVSWCVHGDLCTPVETRESWQRKVAQKYHYN